MTPVSVLYVDDDPSLLEIGKFFLEKKGQFSVDTIISAPAALTLLDTKTYDAIISDYQMPVMDGIAFLKKIRSSGNTLPFILFTGRGREEVIIQALNEGADFYLQKGGEPISQFTELAHQIRQATQKRRAEANIRDLERRESDLINFQPDATVAIDRSGLVIAWNHAMEEVTGVSATEILGKGNYEYSIPFYGRRQPTLIDLIFESDEIIAKKYAHIIHKKDTLIADTIFPTLKGESVTFMAMASPLYDRQGKIIGAIESVRDITERKRSEEALRESEKQYRQIVETTDEGICQLDEKLKLVYVNSRMAEMHGCNPAEMRGQNITLFMVAEDIPANTSRIKERKRGKSGRYERRFVTKDGGVRWMQVSSTPLFDAGGTFRGSFAMYSDITDRKATEEKLRENYNELAKSQNLLLESEKQYRQIVETTTEGIGKLDEKFETIYVNRRMADMLGYTPEEMIGRSYTSFMATEDMPDQTSQLEERRRGKCSRYERRFVTKDGKVRWIYVSATPILDPNGTFRGSFAMHSDITDRKAAEEKLRQNYDELAKSQNLLLESEKQYRQIVETTTEGICKLDEKFETIYVNRRMADMLGYTPEEMIGRSYTSFMATEDVPDQTSQLEERRQGKCSRYERRFVTKDGKVRWIYVSATPILDPNGTFRGSFAMHSDITDRKAAEEGIVRSNEKLHATNKHLSAAEEKLQRNYDKLVKSQRMLAEAMDLANLVNWECDLNTGILTFDDRFSTLYGTDAKDKGINHMTAEAYLQKIVHPEDLHILAEEDEKTRSTTDPHYVSKREYRIVRGDGEVRHIEMCVGVTKDAKCRTIKTHGVNQDITVRKRAEEALRLANHRLNLLSSITRHDINNKITATLGYLKLAEMKSSDPTLDAYLGKMESAITEIQSQIGFTRIYQDLGSKEPRWIALDTVMPRSHVPAMITLNAEVHGVEVFADPMLEKVFFNLLDNSIRHGEQVTEIRVASQKSGDDLLVIWEDNGIGVAADEKERIFERGFGKNTGLGMFLVREILSLTDITIKETGELGKGARFEICIPNKKYRFNPEYRENIALKESS